MGTEPGSPKDGGNAASGTDGGRDDYAGEVQVAGGPPPRWLTRLPYVAIVLGLAYYVHVRATDPVNLVFAALLLVWLVYTPIARKRGWPFLPM
jgi:hypothetical protein